MPRRSAPVELTFEQAEKLDRWIWVGATPQQVVLRAKIVRHAALGRSDKQIAAELKLHVRTVALWRRRVRDEGIEGIWQVAAGRGRKPRFRATTVSDRIERTLHTKPDGATHGALVCWPVRLALVKTRFTALDTIISSSRI